MEVWQINPEANYSIAKLSADLGMLEWSPLLPPLSCCLTSLSSPSFLNPSHPSLFSLLTLSFPSLASFSSIFSPISLLFKSPAPSSFLLLPSSSHLSTPFSSRSTTRDQSQRTHGISSWILPTLLMIPWATMMKKVRLLPFFLISEVVTWFVYCLHGN